MCYDQRCAEDGKDLSVCIVEKGAEVGEAYSILHGVGPIEIRPIKQNVVILGEGTVTDA